MKSGYMETFGMRNFVFVVETIPYKFEKKKKN